MKKITARSRYRLLGFALTVALVIAVVAAVLAGCRLSQ